MERLLYTPTEYIESQINKPVIFLAGPIQGAPDWQSEATGIIRAKRKNIIIASPRKEYLPGDFDYGAQVDWETFHLRRAGGEWRCNVLASKRIS